MITEAHAYRSISFRSPRFEPGAASEQLGWQSRQSSKDRRVFAPRLYGSLETLYGRPSVTAPLRNCPPLGGGHGGPPVQEFHLGHQLVLEQVACVRLHI